MTTTTTTTTTGIHWATIDNGRIVSLHRTRTAAGRAAARHGSTVYATATYAPDLDLTGLRLGVGDRCRPDHGAV